MQRREGTTWCLAFQQGGATQTVLGISFMMHKDVVFDLGQSRIGLVPAECPSYKERPKHFVDSSPPPQPPAPSKTPSTKPSTTRSPMSQQPQTTSAAQRSWAAMSATTTATTRVANASSTATGAAEMQRKRQDMVVRTAGMVGAALIVMLIFCYCRSRARTKATPEERAGIKTQEQQAPESPRRPQVVGRPDGEPGEPDGQGGEWK